MTYSENGLIPRLNTLSEAFDKALQDRFDWVDQMMPHAPGHVKLNTREQLALFEQRMSNPETMAALVKEKGSVEVQRYVAEMRKLQEQHAR